MARGLGIVHGGAAGSATFLLTQDPLSVIKIGTPIVAGGAGVLPGPIIWLTVWIQPVGDRQTPIPVRVAYAGGIQRTG